MPSLSFIVLALTCRSLIQTLSKEMEFSQDLQTSPHGLGQGKAGPTARGGMSRARHRPWAGDHRPWTALSARPGMWDILPGNGKTPERLRGI